MSLIQKRHPYRKRSSARPENSNTGRAAGAFHKSHGWRLRGFLTLIESSATIAEFPSALIIAGFLGAGTNAKIMPKAPTDAVLMVASSFRSSSSVEIPVGLRSFDPGLTGSIEKADRAHRRDRVSYSF